MLSCLSTFMCTSQRHLNCFEPPPRYRSQPSRVLSITGQKVYMMISVQFHSGNNYDRKRGFCDAGYMNVMEFNSLRVLLFQVEVLLGASFPELADEESYFCAGSDGADGSMQLLVPLFQDGLYTYCNFTESNIATQKPTGISMTDYVSCC